METLYDQEKLKAFYDKDAHGRNENALQPWKLKERDNFLQALKTQKAQTLLELGAGTGKDSLFFQNAGLDVTAIDLSSEMVKHCKAKDINASVMDFMKLEFPKTSFDSVYAMNSLLHTPKQNLPELLENIRKILKPEGLFFFGVYGGDNFEGIWQDDWTEPKRFFAYYQNDDLLELLEGVFELVSFREVQVERGAAFHFQSLILKKPKDA